MLTLESGAYQYWDEVFQELSLISKESKQGVTILKLKAGLVTGVCEVTHPWDRAFLNASNKSRLVFKLLGPIQ